MQTQIISQAFKELRSKCNTNKNIVAKFLNSHPKGHIRKFLDINPQDFYKSISRINGDTPIKTEKQGKDVEKIINLANTWHANKNKSLVEIVKIANNGETV